MPSQSDRSRRADGTRGLNQGSALVIGAPQSREFRADPETRREARIRAVRLRPAMRVRATA